MKKVLFVDCCVSGEKSRTRSLADFFIGKLEKTGRYEIDRLHLAKERLTYLSEEGLVERNILLAENRLNHPSFRYARQFAAADKIIITAPFRIFAQREQGFFSFRSSKIILPISVSTTV